MVADTPTKSASKPTGDVASMMQQTPAPDRAG